MSERLSIAIFSDVICPWCFLGKRRLEGALDQLGLIRSTLIQWLPFELNPDMPEGGMERAAYRAHKFGPKRADALDRDMIALGWAEGIAFAFDRQTRTPNTRKAHLLIAHAHREGRGPAAAEALFTAYFVDARDIGGDQVLTDIGVGIGLDHAALEAALGDDQLRDSIIDRETEAARLGLAGVPFFIIDDAWTVSGAQSTDAWVDLLRRRLTVAANAPPR